MDLSAQFPGCTLSPRSLKQVIEEVSQHLNAEDEKHAVEEKTQGETKNEYPSCQVITAHLHRVAEILKNCKYRPMNEFRTIKDPNSGDYDQWVDDFLRRILSTFDKTCSSEQILVNTICFFSLVQLFRPWVKDPLLQQAEELETKWAKEGQNLGHFLGKPEEKRVESISAFVPGMGKYGREGESLTVSETLRQMEEEKQIQAYVSAPDDRLIRAHLARLEAILSAKQMMIHSPFWSGPVSSRDPRFQEMVEVLLDQTLAYVEPKFQSISKVYAIVYLSLARLFQTWMSEDQRDRARTVAKSWDLENLLNGGHGESSLSSVSVRFDKDAIATSSLSVEETARLQRKRIPHSSAVSKEIIHFHLKRVIKLIASQSEIVPPRLRQTFDPEAPFFYSQVTELLNEMEKLGQTSSHRVFRLVYFSLIELFWSWLHDRYPEFQLQVLQMEEEDLYFGEYIGFQQVKSSATTLRDVIPHLKCDTHGSFRVGDTVRLLEEKKKREIYEVQWKEDWKKTRNLHRIDDLIYAHLIVLQRQLSQTGREVPDEMKLIFLQEEEGFLSRINLLLDSLGDWAQKDSSYWVVYYSVAELFLPWLTEERYLSLRERAEELESKKGLYFAHFLGDWTKSESTSCLPDQAFVLTVDGTAPGPIDRLAVLAQKKGFMITTNYQPLYHSQIKIGQSDWTSFLDLLREYPNSNGVLSRARRFAQNIFHIKERDQPVNTSTVMKVNEWDHTGPPYLRIALARGEDRYLFFVSG